MFARRNRAGTRAILSAMSRESIIAEIRKDIAMMERVVKMLGGVKTVHIDTVVGKPTKKRKISAAGRKRIAAAQRARWAKIRAAEKK